MKIAKALYETMPSDGLPRYLELPQYFSDIESAKLAGYRYCAKLLQWPIMYNGVEQWLDVEVTDSLWDNPKTSSKVDE